MRKALLTIRRFALPVGFLGGLGLTFVPSGGCGGVQPVAEMPVRLAEPIRSCAVMHEHHLTASDHTVKFDVGLVNGQVDSIVLVQSTLADEELEACLATAIRSFTVDDLPLRASANLERDLASPESRELFGNPAAAPLAVCLASAPCLLALVVVVGATAITMQLTVYSATTTAPITATPTTTATPVPTTTATATATTTTTSPPIAVPRRCLPCLPVPVGGTAYRYDSAAEGKRPHYGMANHTHHFKMHQSPPAKGCQCFWDDDFIHPTPEFSPLPGAVPVTPASGGGLAP